MQFTIDKRQKSVAIDGVVRVDIDLGAMPAGVEAVQWGGAIGLVEYRDAESPKILRRKRIESVAEYQEILAAFSVPVAATAQPVISPAQAEAVAATQS